MRAVRVLVGWVMKLSEQGAPLRTTEAPTWSCPNPFSRRNVFMTEVQREAWDTPQIEEIGLGFEITAYVNDSEFSR
jgi:coenzyme PQQ precursor peptide PqqA